MQPLGLDFALGGQVKVNRSQKIGTAVMAYPARRLDSCHVVSPLYVKVKDLAKLC